MVDIHKTYFKNIIHFNCSLDFNLTHLLTVEVILSSNTFLEEVNICFIDCFTTSMLKVPLNKLPEKIEF